jgi:hypothetical protein
MEEHSVLQPGSVLPPTRRVPAGAGAGGGGGVLTREVQPEDQASVLRVRMRQQSQHNTARLRHSGQRACRQSAACHMCVES